MQQSPAVVFVRESIRRKRWSYAKIAGWVVVPATLIVGLVEYNVREARVKSDYARLDSESKSEQNRAIQDLVAGCYEHDSHSYLPKYFAERLFGQCRLLNGVQLSEANLNSADLSYGYFENADLSNASFTGASLIQVILYGSNLKGTDFTNAYIGSSSLSKADLSEANLSDSDLHDSDLSDSVLIRTNLTSSNLKRADLSGALISEANLDGTNLTNADLSRTVIISTDLRNVEWNTITQQQLEGVRPPLICNSPLPPYIVIEGGKDRDCYELSTILRGEYSNWLEFKDYETSEKFVNEQRRKIWKE